MKKNNEIDDLIEALELLDNQILELTSEMKLISEIKEIHSNPKIVADVLMSKKYADGLIEKLDNASLSQLQNMRANPRNYFRIGTGYYKQAYLEKLLDNQILKTKRKIVLNKLVNDK